MHVRTLSEVKERVVQYLPVIARPLVSRPEPHQVRWTGVYANIQVINRFLCVTYLAFRTQNIPCGFLRNKRKRSKRNELKITKAS